MDYIEATLIVVICIILNLIGTALLIKLILIKAGLQPYIRMAKQFASQMGLKSQAVQHEAKQKVMAKEAKAKVARAAVDSLPGGGMLGKIIERAGVTPDEIFALLQDQDFIRGIKVLMDTFSGVVQKITGKGESEQKQLPMNETQFG